MSAAKEEWVHQLYLQHAPDLYRIAKYRLQDPDTAYDLTQEVFLTLLSKSFNFFCTNQSFHVSTSFHLSHCFK